MHIPKAFYLNLRLPKDYHQEKVHSTLSHLLYVNIFCLQWFTSNVLIPKDISQKHGYLI
jgi:hypothetical protein